MEQTALSVDNVRAGQHRPWISREKSLEMVEEFGLHEQVHVFFWTISGGSGERISGAVHATGRSLKNVENSINDVRFHFQESHMSEQPHTISVCRDCKLLFPTSKRYCSHRGAHETLVLNPSTQLRVEPCSDSQTFARMLWG
jgi:hypothetical protein